MKRKKICHVISKRNVIGTERWLINYLKYSDKDLFDITVILPKGNIINEVLKEYDCEILNIHSVKVYSAKFGEIKMFYKAFKQIKPDLVQVHGCFAAILGAKLAGVKHIISTKHFIEEPTEGIFKKGLKKYYNTLFTDKIIAVSAAVRESLITLGINQHHIERIYNGVDLLKKIPEEEKNLIKQKYGIDETCYCVGIVSKLEPVKDLSTFILAADKISHIRDDVKFIIAGTGTLEDDLKDETETLDMRDTVIFTGHVKEIEKIINILDIIVMTSKSDAFSLSILEGMSIGIPAICTDAGGNKEIIENKKTGELIDIGDFNQLSAKVLELIDDKELYGEYSANCCLAVESKFSAQIMAKNIETLYKDCLDKRRR